MSIEDGKTKLPKAANTTRDPRNPNRYNENQAADTPWYWKPRIGSGYGFAPKPVNPYWTSAWDAYDYSMNPSAMPMYPAAPAAGRNFYQNEAYPIYEPPGQTVQEQKPLGYDYGMMLDNISQQSSTGEFMASTPTSGQPLDNKAAAPTAGQPSYEPRYDIDAYGNPTDPYWYQNNNYGQSVLMWDENNQLNGRPGVPEAAVIEARKSLEKWASEHPGEKWTSTYTPDFYKTQRPDDFNVWGIAGGMGKRNGTTQLRWGTPTPDWVRKVLEKNKDTNKSYDQSQLDQNQPVNLRNIPGWAGDLVSWRT